MTNSSTRTTPDQAKTLRDLNPRPNAIRLQQETAPHTFVYSITSGKGGVGKTAVVANLAYALASLDKQVLILDADLGLANIDVVFGLTPEFNLNHFFSGEKELDEILIDGPLTIKILPAGSGLQNFTRLDSHNKIRLMDSLDSMHNHFDFVLIDTEAGISENVTYFNSAAQEILVVTTPEPTAITDAYSLMKLLSTQYHEKKFNLLVNQVQSEENALDVYKKLAMVSNRYLDISIDYLGSIPEDPQMIESIRKQKVISEILPESATSDAFKQLAARICTEPARTAPKGNIQFFWRKLLNMEDRS